MKRLRALAVVGLSTALWGCGSPQEAVVQFHRALARGDGPEALKRLSQETRAELARRAQAASDATGRAVSADPATMIVQAAAIDPGAAGRAEEVNLLELRGDRARVRARIAGELAEVEVLNEGGRWHLVLPLSKAPPPERAP